MTLQGSNVLIIGGSSGTGLATAQLARREGANVIIVSRSSEKLQRAVEQLGDVKAIVADMTNESDVEKIFSELNRVDHIFISAGSYFGAKVIGTDLDTFRSDVAQKFWRPLYIVRNAVPKMTNGSITFLTGQLASRPDADSAVTSALLAALETLGRDWRSSWRRSESMQWRRALLIRLSSATRAMMRRNTPARVCL